MKALKSKLHCMCVVCCLLCTSLLLAGCDQKSEEQIAQETIAKNNIMGLGVFGVLMIFLTAIVGLISLTTLLTSSTSQERGTNAASKFIRHNATYGRQKRAMLFNGCVAAFDVIGLVTRFTIPKLLITLVPFALIFYAFKLMQRGTKSKDRVQATRTVTKESITMGADAAAGALYTGSVVALASGVGAPVALGLAGAGTIVATQHSHTERLRGVMEDVDHGREVREFPELTDGDVIDPEEFIKKAVKLGCSETASIEEMTAQVLKYAPQASLDELPNTMSDTEKAARLLGTVKSAQLPDKKVDE